MRGPSWAARWSSPRSSRCSPSTPGRARSPRWAWRPWPTSTAGPRPAATTPWSPPSAAACWPSGPCHPQSPASCSDISLWSGCLPSIALSRLKRKCSAYSSCSGALSASGHRSRPYLCSSPFMAALYLEILCRKIRKIARSRIIRLSLNLNASCSKFKGNYTGRLSIKVYPLSYNWKLH